MNNMSQSCKICYKKFDGLPTPPDPIFTSARDRGCKKPSTNATQHFNIISGYFYHQFCLNAMF